MRPRKWTDQQLVKAVETSLSYSGVVRRLRLSEGGAALATVKRRIQELDLDTSHFTNSTWIRYVNEEAVDLSTDVILRSNEDRTVSNINLRRTLIEKKIFEPRCSRCHLTTWQGEDIPLQLCHKDGNWKNNDTENLEILCANCHAIQSCHTPKRISRRALKSPPKRKRSPVRIQF